MVDRTLTPGTKTIPTSNDVVERISEHSDADACQRTLDLLNDAAADIKRLQEVIARCYMRLQCADVPREPWHWEVCTTLNNTGIPAKPSEQCPYCLHPVRIDGSILHAGGCAGLDTIKVTRLQYDTLTKAHGNETGELQRALHVIDEAGKLSDWINRARPVVTDLMAAYERRIRTDCTPEQLAKKPWRCMEYIGAENLLRDQPIAVVELTTQKANSCVCAEPNSPGTHRTDGPCLAPIGDHHP